MGAVVAALLGVALATLSAWRHHDLPLVGVGVVVMAVVGAGAIYVARRRP
jgi:hypothetical protein